MLGLTLLSVFSAFLLGGFKIVFPKRTALEAGKALSLPQPRLKGEVTVEEAIASRRSRRKYSEKPLELWELGQLLWAAQGITEPNLKFRAAPSAGATYPLEVYVEAGSGSVKGLQAGVYHYKPENHSISMVKPGDFHGELRSAALGQEWVGRAAVNLVICAVYERTTGRYGERGRIRYVHMEAGHAGENIYLQAEALGLATVAVGAFYDEQVSALLSLPENHKPLYIYPVGRKP
ncbi:MAG: nitroreductase [Candidatus Hecatellales archaeon B24]|nr:MAG: nitroreductase [Candidatus Hecatellales archaeon B24]